MNNKRSRGLTPQQQEKIASQIPQLWNRATHTVEQIDALLDLLQPFSYPVVHATLREAWQADSWSPNPGRIREIATRRTQYARDHSRGDASTMISADDIRDPILERAKFLVSEMTPEAIKSRASRLIREGRVNPDCARGAFLHPWATRAVVVLDECERLRTAPSASGAH